MKTLKLNSTFNLKINLNNSNNNKNYKIFSNPQINHKFLIQLLPSYNNNLQLRNNLEKNK